MQGRHSDRLLSLLVFGTLLSGCGGGGESSSSQTPPPAPVRTGVFLDAAVEGLSYTSTSGESGVTNAAGEYKYKDGAMVTFSLGSIQFPAVAAARTVTPFSFFESRNLHDPELLNTLRLLQSLDADKDPSNNIQLDASAVQRLTAASITFADLALSADEFEQLLVSTDVFTAAGNTSMVSKGAAMQHFASTLNSSSQLDTDGDGISNVNDTDDDNDGVPDSKDLFPWDSSESTDFDLDGIGDSADDDDDNDGIVDVSDPTLRLIYEMSSSVVTITHHQYHADSNKLFITNKGAKSLLVINPDDGQVLQTLTFEKMPWRMALSGNTLYVSLLNRDFQYYSTEGEGGEVVVMDISGATAQEIRRFNVTVDPFDIVATSQGKVIVSSGSNQWTSIQAYNGSDGVFLGSAGIRHQSYLSLDPAEKAVFAADTDLSPSDFEKFDISVEGISALGDSPYHGSFSPSGRVWAAGEYVFSRSGNVYNASDMTYVSRILPGQSISDVQVDMTQNIAFVVSAGVTYLVNLESAEVFRGIANPGVVQHVLVGDAINYTLAMSNNSLVLVKTPHPCPSCGTNTKPVANFTYTPTQGSTTDTYEFDASVSNDAEDGHQLQFRWDMDNDGQWDTNFSTDPQYSQKFLTAGTKFVTLQVRDSAGALHSKTIDIQVEQGIDSGEVINDSAPFELQFNVTATAIDSVRQKMYVSDKSAKRLYVVNLQTGQTEKFFQFSYMPERMTISPDGAKLYLALLTQEHSSYWWEEEQNGYIAVFDLAQQAQVNVYEIPTDPYDLVVNGQNKLIVSSGSGQWTDIYAFNADDGTVLGKAGIRQASRLSLHPSGEMVFAADTDSSPSDFEKFDISGTGIVSVGDSPYHGDHSIAGQVWVSPAGDILVSRGGDIFRTSDMTYVQSISGINGAIKQVTFDSAQNLAFVVMLDGQVSYYNLTTWVEIDSLAVSDATGVVVVDGSVLVLQNGGVNTQLVSLDHPCMQCGANTAPVASFTYTPAQGTTLDTYEFDASSSSDAEDGAALQYRWNFDNDNQWDTEFSDNPLTSKKFIAAGTRFVTLQVKDSAGALHSKTLDVEVAQGIDYGTTVNDSVAYSLAFDVTATATDAVRNKLYVSDQAAKRLYVVNLETGLTEKYFEFVFMPERMTISPDGETLYLALLTQQHSYSWWKEDQSGYIAVFDLAQQAQTLVYGIPTDPYDLVVNDQNKLVVSSGSGQWTDIYAFNANDGAVLGKSSIRQSSRLSLHPSSDLVFAADTDITPSDFQKFDISGTGIRSLGDSPYHGDYYIDGKVWLSPDGNNVISRGGDMFRVADMNWLQALDGVDSAIHDIVFDTDNNRLLMLTDASLTALSLSDYSVTSVLPSQGAKSLVMSNGRVFGLLNGGLSTTVIEYVFE